MKKIHITVLLFTICFSSFAKVDSLVQPQVRFSPTMIANLLTEEKSYLKLTYGQPLKKGRKIFGNLVPFGQIWRLGANEATELTVSKDFEIGNKQLKAGTYALFATPSESKWTIYFNRKLGQWGTFEYQESENVFSVDVPVVKNSDVYEGFTIELREIENKLINILFFWDDVKTVLPVQIIDSIKEKAIQETPKEKRKRLRRERRGK